MEEFISKLPKAELHLHIEGSMTSELCSKIASRNNITIGTIEEIDQQRRSFTTLLDFVNIYDSNCIILQTSQDFYDIVFDYLTLCAKLNTLYCEISFCTNLYTERGISFSTIFEAIYKAKEDAERLLNVKSNFILNFIKHLSYEENLKMLNDSIPYIDKITGIGISGTELGNSGIKYKKLYDEARRLGYKNFTAHSGEEGDPSYIIDTLYYLQVSRIDHGVRCLDDPFLVAFLKEEQIPLTVCPLSNYHLNVLQRFFNGEHCVRKLIESGLLITINSDDPPLLGGNINQNYLIVANSYNDIPEIEVKKILAGLAKNSFRASFLEESEKLRLELLVDAYMKDHLQVDN